MSSLSVRPCRWTTKCQDLVASPSWTHQLYPPRRMLLVLVQLEERKICLPSHPGDLEQSNDSNESTFNSKLWSFRGASTAVCESLGEDQ